MKKYLAHLLSFFALTVGSASMAAASDYERATAHLSIRGDEITEIKFYSHTAEINVVNPENSNLKTYVVFQGKVNQPNSTLVVNNRILVKPGTKDGAFKNRIEIDSALSEFDFVLIDHRGQVKKEKVIVSYPEFTSSVLASGDLPSAGKRLGVGAGITHLSYRETQLAELDETLISLKASYQFGLGKRWDFGANAFIDAIPLSNDQSPISARIFGSNLRVGYSIPGLGQDWALSIAGGVYYTSMMTSGLDFGYRNMVGPQLYPTIRRAIGWKDILSLTLKYSPISSGISPTFSSHELAAGASWTHSMSKLKTISVGLDYADDEINLDGGVFTASAKSTTLGFSYGF